MEKIRNRKIRNRMKRWKIWLRRRDGTTLVELIVCFALLSILLTSASMVMGTYMKMFTHVREYGNQQTLATTLLDTIEYELGSAEPGEYTDKEGTSDVTRSGVTISADGTQIYFRNRDYIPVKMKKQSPASEDSLCMEYYVKGSSSTGDPADVSTGKVQEWYYGQGVYKKNNVKSLKFEPFESSGKAVCVKVTLELESTLEKNVDYKITRIVHCYKLTGDTEGSKVHN